MTAASRSTERGSTADRTAAATGTERPASGRRAVGRPASANSEPAGAAPDRPRPGDTPSDTSATTPAPRARLVGLDLARGLAVLGMFVAHTAAAGPYAEGTWLGEVLSWSHGRSSILFALLAGVSLGILTGRTEPYTGERAVHARLRILVRAVLLLGISGVLALFNGQVALILAFYAAWFFLALPAAWKSPRWLFTAAAAVAVAGPLLRWMATTFLPAVGLEVHSGDSSGFFLETLVSGTYPGLAYMTFVFLGMGLSRLRLDTPRVQARLLVVGVLLAVAGYGSGWALSTALGVDTSEPDPLAVSQSAPAESSGQDDGLPAAGDPVEFGPDGQPIGLPASLQPGPGAGADLADTAATDLLAFWPHSGSTFEIVGSGGVALAILGLCLLAPPVLGRTVLAPLAAVGAMSLTAYSVHVLVLAMVPPMVGADSAIPMLVLVIGALLGCWAWRATLGRGPLETLLHATSVLATLPPSR